MASYLEDVKKLSELCRKCWGLCCNGGKEGSAISISYYELKKLKKPLEFKIGISKSPYGSMNKIVIQKDKPCPFIGGQKGKHLESGCILKGCTRPLGCRLFPLTFVIERNKLKFYLSGFCPYVKEAAKLESWINKTIKEARGELKTWTKTEKLCR